jgi:hypothetical protein
MSPFHTRYFSKRQNKYQINNNLFPKEVITMMFEVDDFVPHKSNTLQGFFTVYFPECGISIPGFSYHESITGSRWIDFPSKPNKNGEYEKVINSYDTRKAKRFREQLLKALDEYMKDKEQNFDTHTDI